MIRLCAAVRATRNRVDDLTMGLSWVAVKLTGLACWLDTRIADRAARPEELV